MKIRPQEQPLDPQHLVAFELVPPNADLGPEQAVEEARKVLRFSKEAGIDGQIGHVMIPGMIEEDATSRRDEAADGRA